MLGRKEEEEVVEEPGVDSTLVAFVAAEAVFVKHLVPFTNLGCLLESKGRSGASYTTTEKRRRQRPSHQPLRAARAASVPPLPAETFVLVLRQAQAVVRRDRGGGGLLQFSVKLHTPDIEQVMIPWPRSRLPQDQSHINSPLKAEDKVSPSSTFC